MVHFCDRVLFLFSNGGTKIKERGQRLYFEECAHAREKTKGEGKGATGASKST